jgi:hypothetical protein
VLCAHRVGAAGIQSLSLGGGEDESLVPRSPSSVGMESDDSGSGHTKSTSKMALALQGSLKPALADSAGTRVQVTVNKIGLKDADRYRQISPCQGPRPTSVDKCHCCACPPV